MQFEEWWSQLVAKNPGLSDQMMRMSVAEFRRLCKFAFESGESSHVEKQNAALREYAVMSRKFDSLWQKAIDRFRWRI